MVASSRIATSSGSFLVDGSERFLLADTVWSAFSSATDDEWLMYLRRRSAQGFNGVLVSVLPILHDRSTGSGGVAPFDEDRVRERGSWELNPAFFERARQRLDLAAEHGIVCCLVLLWVNYVQGTWGAQRAPGFAMSLAAQEEYLASLAKVVGDGETMLIITGDNRFESAEEVATYASFTERVRATWPSSPVAYHLAPHADLPPELEAMADALIFQSGHHGEDGTLARELAGRYRAIAGDRPVMNAEPCYEASRIGGTVGRFGRAAVRRRSWESVVGGASAGLAYGAQGLWSWHRDGDAFNGGHFSGAPLDWREALFLPGAEDAAACRRRVEAEGLFQLAERSDLLSVADEGWGAGQVVVGVDAKRRVAAVYLPNGGPVTLEHRGTVQLRRAVDLGSGHDVRAACTRLGARQLLVDPPAGVSEALLVLDLR